MKRVVQKHRAGCGVACVAMIVGVSYDAALMAFPIEVRDRIKRDSLSGTKTRDLLHALLWFGYAIPDRRIPMSEFPFARPCIAAVENGHKRNWHWVVWDGKKVLDPTDGPPLKEYVLKSVLPFFEIKDAT